MKEYSKSNQKNFTFSASVILFISTLLIFPNMAAAADEKPAKAKVIAVSNRKEGEVLFNMDGGEWKDLYRLKKLGETNSVKTTGEKGWVELKFPNDKGRVRLGSLSCLKINGMKIKAKGDKEYTESFIYLKYGRMRVKFDKDSDSIMTVKTDNAEFIIEKADSIFEYNHLSEKTLVVVNDVYDEGSVLVNSPKVFEYYGTSLPRRSKIEIIGEQENFEVKDASGELSQFERTMKFVGENGIGVTKTIEEEASGREEKSLPNIDNEADDFVRKFVGYLNSESISGIRGMVSSRYTGNIGGFGGKTALINGLKEHFETGTSVRLSYSVGNVSSTDEKGKEIIINANIGGKSIKFWINEEGSSYSLTHAEGRWFFD